MVGSENNLSFGPCAIQNVKEKLHCVLKEMHGMGLYRCWRIIPAGDTSQDIVININNKLRTLAPVHASEGFVNLFGAFPLHMLCTMKV